MFVGDQLIMFSAKDIPQLTKLNTSHLYEVMSITDHGEDNIIAILTPLVLLEKFELFIRFTSDLINLPNHSANHYYIKFVLSESNNKAGASTSTNNPTFFYEPQEVKLETLSDN
jgi:hypothetical protein